MNLEKMSLEDLKKTQKEIEKAIKTFEVRRMAEARAELEKKAAELGVSLKDVVGGGGSSKTAGSVSPPKYMHPENPEKTWTGRGRKPKWIEAGIAAGKKLEDFLIK